MAIAKGKEPIRVFYSYVDGAHFFHSPHVKGLCAASRDLRAAYRAVGIQLGALLAKPGEEPRVFEPIVPVELFEQAISAQAPQPVADLQIGVIAKWKTTKNMMNT